MTEPQQHDADSVPGPPHRPAAFQHTDQGRPSGPAAATAAAMATIDGSRRSSSDVPASRVHPCMKK
ncbi:hypothetical protein ACWEOZ_38760 [Actinoplanes sp. NPDC004185]